MTSISEGEHAQIVQDASVPVGVSPLVQMTLSMDDSDRSR